MAIKVIPNPNPLLQLIYTTLGAINGYISGIYSGVYTITGNWYFTFDKTANFDGNLITIDEPHAEIHAGRFFVCSQEGTLNNDGIETPVLEIGNFNEAGHSAAHICVNARVQSELNFVSQIIGGSLPLYEGYATLKIYENYEGNPQTQPISRNRILLADSSWKTNNRPSGVAGNLIYEEKLNKYEGIIAKLREHSEFIFNPDYVYLVTLTSHDNTTGRTATRYGLNVNWYEVPIKDD